jgi:hypothetical protein
LFETFVGCSFDSRRVGLIGQAGRGSHAVDGQGRQSQTENQDGKGELGEKRGYFGHFAISFSMSAF